MRRVFADTSAFYALLVADDANHVRAATAFEGLAGVESALVTTSYVLLETYALLQRRVGMAAVSGFRHGIMPLLEVRWVDAALHEKALDRVLGRGPESLSLVDATSFEVIRDSAIDCVFAYDQHFVAEGFELL